MIDQESEAFKAAVIAALEACVAFMAEHGVTEMTLASEYPSPRDQAERYVAAAIKAYEAARPKLPTITGLPEALRDGTRIVGWAWRKAGHGEWWYAGGAFGLIQGPAFEARPVAITEADYE